MLVSVSLLSGAINAGIGAGGAFAHGPVEDRTDFEPGADALDLNVRSTVHFAKLVIADLVERGEGRVPFTLSIAATRPGASEGRGGRSINITSMHERASLPGTAAYCAVKGGLGLLTKVMAFELAGHGIMDNTRLAGHKDPVADVARAGIEALLNGDERVVASSLRTRLQHLAGRFLSDTVKGELVRHVARPGSRR